MTFFSEFPAACIAIGWAGILVEFARPGWVLPGTLGGVFLMVGISECLHDSPATVIAASAPFLIAGAWMIAVARTARRNKRAL